MGNSLQQYRLVVGMHCVYLAVMIREYRGCFKGKFWCSMLLLFYLEAIYLPVLKRVIRYFELTKMNRLWLTQIFLYRFNIPELIRLANDVDTNLGPVVTDFDSSKTICAPYSQSGILFGENRGKQSVANSIISTVYQHHRLIHSAADMAQILWLRSYTYLK